MAIFVQMPSMAKKRVVRRAKRHPVRWLVKDINGQPVSDAWVVDVSCMGARLETPSPLGPNNPVEITVILPDGVQELQLSGRVRWSRFVLASPGRFHQGVQFYGVNWDLDRLGKEGQP
jgi:hypothetical protein